jgi:hypothetical protein
MLITGLPVLIIAHKLDCKNNNKSRLLFTKPGNRLYGRQTIID